MLFLAKKSTRISQLLIQFSFSLLLHFFCIEMTRSEYNRVLILQQLPDLLHNITAIIVLFDNVVIVFVINGILKYFPILLLTIIAFDRSAITL